MAQNKPTFPRSGLHKGKPSSVLCSSKRRKVRTERKKEEEEEEGGREVKALDFTRENKIWIGTFSYGILYKDFKTFY